MGRGTDERNAVKNPFRRKPKVEKKKKEKKAKKPEAQPEGKSEAAKS